MFSNCKDVKFLAFDLKISLGNSRISSKLTPGQFFVKGKIFAKFVDSLLY